MHADLDQAGSHRRSADQVSEELERIITTIDPLIQDLITCANSMPDQVHDERMFVRVAASHLLDTFTGIERAMSGIRHGLARQTIDVVPDLADLTDLTEDPVAPPEGAEVPDVND